MKKFVKVTSLILSTAMIAGALVGCGGEAKQMKAAMDSGESATVTMEGKAGDNYEELTWMELDQLRTHNDIRRGVDDVFGVITFDVGSKNGMIYADSEGNWNGNSTLYQAFRNKTFAETYSDHKTLKQITEAARKEFSDATAEDIGSVMGMNAYFNVLPSGTDGTSALGFSATRAEAMGAIFRADTPVEVVEPNAEFAAAVGDDEWNIYAQNLDSYSWLTTEDGSLSSENYTGFISKVEYIYMLMNRYFPEQLAGIKGGELGDAKSEDIAKKAGFSSKDGSKGHAWRSYVLEYMLKHPDDGVQTELFNALVLANKLGIINSVTGWSDPVSRFGVVNLLIKTYQAMGNSQGYDVAVQNGMNAGDKLEESADLLALQEEINRLNAEKLANSISSHDDTVSHVGDVTGPQVVNETETEQMIEEPVDVTDTDAMLDVYGDEFNLTDEEYEEAKSVLAGFTIEECDKYMVVNSSVNVRVGPSTEFRVVTSLAYKQIMHVTGRCAETGWYRIATAEGKIAYVCGAYMTDIATDEPEPETTAKTTTISKEEAEQLKGAYEGKAAGDTSNNENLKDAEYIDEAGYTVEDIEDEEETETVYG